MPKRRIPMTPAEARDLAMQQRDQREVALRGEALASAFVKRAEIDPKAAGPVGFDLGTCEWVIDEPSEAPKP